ncbi:peroxisomal membrane protein 11A [Thalassophryne amazonica]|uniref:peroxisomal membrane protein 11A n=1 Tax=Thalassophryne amazonica TaxID=390379 RepID=UPI001470AEC9|nr:peroxisomal membrane protein 11A [Thalassophryne amazonica]
MDAFVKLANQSQGRDRVFRATQYACVLATYLLRNFSGKKHFVARLKNVEANMSAGRKLFRLGNTVSSIEAAKWTVRLSDPVLCLCLTAANVSRALYFFCDNLLWAGKVGLIDDIDKERWSTNATHYYLYSVVMSLVRDISVIARLMVQRVRDKQFEKRVNLHLSESPEVAAVVIPQLDCFVFVLVEILKSHPAVTMDLLKNLCDITIPLDSLGIYRSTTGVVGLCGLISSLIGIVTLTQPKLKMNP